MKKGSTVLVLAIVAILTTAFIGFFIGLDTDNVAIQGMAVKDSPANSQSKKIITLADLQPYIVELEEKPLVYKNIAAKSKGLEKAALKQEMARQKKALAQEKANTKRNIENKLGIILSTAQSLDKQRRITQEFDTVFHGFSVELTPEEAEKLKKHPGIKNVYPDNELQIELDNSIPLLNADDAWEIIGSKGAPLTGEGMRIGVIDTGIDYTHPDLGGIDGVGCFGKIECKVVGGYDFADNDPDPMEIGHHGTHVASIVAGNGIKKGVAPDAKLYAYKVTNQIGTSYDRSIIAALEMCADPNQDGNTIDHLDVCTISLGSLTANTPATSGTAAAADATVDAGVVVVASAGNDGPFPRTIKCPACAEKVIAVGAALSCLPGTCTLDPIRSTSSRGPVTWTDELGTHTIIKPDVVAPGESICAAKSTSSNPSPCQGSSEHALQSGTSMAAPMVAGMAAIIKQAKPYATPLEIKQIIKDTANPYTEIDINTQGAGIIDILAALESISPDLKFTPDLYTVPYEYNIENNIQLDTFLHERSLFIKNTQDQEVTVLISVADPPGITTQLDQTKLTILPNNQEYINVITTINNLQKISAQGSTIRIESLQDPLDTVTVKSYIKNPPRIITPPKLEFPNIPGSITGYTEITTNLEITDNQQRTETYTITSDCCRDTKALEDVSTIEIEHPTTVTANAGQTLTIPLKAKLDTTTLANKRYTGSITLSSPTQDPISIPFEIRYGNLLRVTFDHEAAPEEISITDSWTFESNILPKLTDHVDFVIPDNTRPIDIIGIWQMPDGEYNKHIVIKEGLSLSGFDTIHISHTEATNKIQQEYTNLDGQPIEKILAEKMFLKNRDNDFMVQSPPNTYPTGKATPRTYYFNTISPKYIFVNYALPYLPNDLSSTIIFEHILDQGIYSSQTLTNTAQDLIKIPIKVNNPPTTPLNFQLEICERRDTTCYKRSGGCLRAIGAYNPKSLDSSNNWVHDLFVLKHNVDQQSLRIPSKIISLYNDQNTYTYTSPDLQFDDQGIMRWISDNNLHAPSNNFPPIISSTNTDQISVNLGIPIFQGTWIINNPGQTFKPINKELGTIILGQDGDELNLNWEYVLLRNGQQINQANYENKYMNLPTQNQPGTYNFILSSQETKNGQQLSYTYNTEFSLPETTNSEPPTLIDIDLSTGDIGADILDQTKENKISYRLHPGTGLNYNTEVYLNEIPQRQDTISQTLVRIKTEQTAWTSLTPTYNTDFQKYETNLPNLEGNLYTIEITAEDQHENKITYTFDVPTGTITGEPNTRTGVPPISDIEGPNIHITNPQNGETISEQIYLRIEGIDHTSINLVEFFIDGKRPLTSSYEGIGGTTSLDTTTLTDGTHEIQAVATDANDNVGYSAPITITVDNGASTTTPPTTGAPTVEFVNPLDGTTIPETTTTLQVRATVIDDTDTRTKAELFLDGSLIQTRYSNDGNHFWLFSISDMQPGSHQLRIDAYDSTDNYGLDGAGNKGNSTINIIKSGDVPPGDTEAPTIPTNLQSPTILENQVDLTWTASTDNNGVIGYRIYRDSVQIGTATSTSFGDGTVQPSTTYSYQVSAYDAAGLESQKATLSVTIPECHTNADCPSSEICEVDTCVVPPPECGDGTVNGNEICDGGSQICTTISNYSGTKHCNSACTDYGSCFTNEYCGDGITNGPETCEDGNLINGDGCNSCQTSCQITSAIWEQPTFVNEGSSSEITLTGTNCNGETLEINVYEKNTLLQDELMTLSPIETTFNGNTATTSWTAEWRCDPEINPLSCSGPEYYFAAYSPSSFSTITSDKLNNLLYVEQVTPDCGNGLVQSPEECDDGNNINGDGCSSTCTDEPVCGDGIKEGTEECDDNNNINGDGCSSICTLEPICGNNIVELPELCDGTNLNGEDCISQEYYSGTLLCNALCTSFITNQCELPPECITDSDCNSGEMCEANSCVPEPVPPPTTIQTQIAGTVTTGLFNNPVPGATIEILIPGRKGKSGLLTSQVTNPQGEYAIVLSSGGNYDISVKADGYNSQKISINIAEGEEALRYFELTTKTKGGGKKK